MVFVRDLDLCLTTLNKYTFAILFRCRVYLCQNKVLSYDLFCSVKHRYMHGGHGGRNMIERVITTLSSYLARSGYPFAII